jgi:hypothetical protein
MRSRTQTAIQPAIPASGGRPSWTCQSVPSNLSVPRRAKRVATSSWPSARTFTAPRRDVRRWLSRSDLRSRANVIIGGCSDSDANELTVVPCGRPCAVMVVTTVTWAQTELISSLNAVPSITGAPRTGARWRVRGWPSASDLVNRPSLTVLRRRGGTPGRRRAGQ